MFYISALCEDAIEGKKLLKAAVNSLFSVPISGSPESISTEQSENSEEVKPTLLWGVLYIQELTMVCPSLSLSVFSMAIDWLFSLCRHLILNLSSL